MQNRLHEAQKFESLGVLAGGIAHDFNNLLTGILGHASLLAATLPSTSRAQSSIAQIESSSLRAADLCRHMLAYSGQGRYFLKTFELGTLVENTLPSIDPNLTKAARLQTDFVRDLPFITADLAQISQAITNLVVNAYESIGENGGEITLLTRRVYADGSLFATCVQAPELPSGDYVMLEVTDTGSGMDAETVTRIFDPFFSTKFTGRGLGLAAVFGIIRGHQGAIRVTTRLDHGTTMRLYFPAAVEKTPAPSPLLPKLQSTVIQHLLLVDDETSVREISAEVLRTIGYLVTTAANGEEALRTFLASPTPFHAALIDLTMPGMDGGEVMKAIRKLRPDFPVILMSGYEEKDAAAYLSEPRTSFLAKPFTLETLRAKITTLLSAS